MIILILLCIVISSERTGDVCPVSSQEFVIQPDLRGPHFGGRFLTQNLDVIVFSVSHIARQCQNAPSELCDQLLVRTRTSQPINRNGNFSVRYDPAAASGEQPIEVAVLYGKKEGWRII